MINFFAKSGRYRLEKTDADTIILDVYDDTDHAKLVLTKQEAERLCYHIMKESECVDLKDKE